MPGIARFANEARTALEQVVSAIEVPHLTKLVTLETGWREGNVFSPEWERLTKEELGKKDDEWIEEQVDRFEYAKKLTTSDGKSPIILQAYNPMVIPLPLGDDETYRQLKERIEGLIAHGAEIVRAGFWEPVNVLNAYHIGKVRLEYRIPNERAETIIACMPIAGDSFLSKPASELLKSRWTFTLTYFNIEE